MAAAQAGDRRAYDGLLHECLPLIATAARGRGVPPDMVDDVVQETLIAVHRARHTYDPARSFTAWLKSIAELRAIDVLRRQGRQRAREVHEPHAYEAHADDGRVPADEEIEADQSRWRLREAVSGLPEGQREAVEQMGLADRSLAEAAGLTGKSTGALKVSLHRAIRTLQSRLKREDW
jgi:RNA polymerase sigma-70 factor (ECF subfamily)